MSAVNETGLSAARTDAKPANTQANTKLALRLSEIRDPGFPGVPTGMANRLENSIVRIFPG